MFELKNMGNIDFHQITKQQIMGLVHKSCAALYGIPVLLITAT